VVPAPCRYDQQHVGDQAEHAVPGPAEEGGRDADQHRDQGGAEPGQQRDQQHRPGSPHHLREHVLAEGRRAQQVLRGRAEAARVDLGVRVVVRDDPGEQGHQAEEQQQQRADGGLPIGDHGAGHAPQRAGSCHPAGRRRQPAVPAEERWGRLAGFADAAGVAGGHDRHG